MNIRFQVFILIVFTLVACDSGKNGDPEPDMAVYPDWTTATHSNNSDPNYEEVFPENKVNKLEIVLEKGAWSDIKADMEVKAGYAFGTRSSQAGGGGGIQPGGIGGGVPPVGGGGQNGGGALDLVKGDPVYVKAGVKFNGKEWYSVGFRLKGNSSLSQSWGSGIYKLPFKLQFDEFEDEIPALKNQRFYGFKEFSFSPGQGDNSLIRDKLGAEIFRNAGIPAARAAFYEISIDFGEGLKYCGLYTMLEVIDDTMVKSQFGEDKGNIYKPESNFLVFNIANFEKKNNKEDANYSDVQSVITVLNANNKRSDSEQWRAALEKVFDVDHFLKYLAVNNTIVNWDSYGVMAHNHYLYTPTKNNKVTWIPWDLNLSMQSTTQTQSNNNQGGGMNRSGVSLGMSEVTSQWPLIRYLADDPVYFQKYKGYLKEFNEGAFDISNINTKIEYYQSLIKPSVSKEISPYSYGTSNFDASINSLKSHLQNRKSVLAEFLK